MTKVFLSSTSIDLRAARKAATLAIRNLDQHDCIGMESFGARNSEPIEACLEKLRERWVYCSLGGPSLWERPFW